MKADSPIRRQERRGHHDHHLWKEYQSTKMKNVWLKIEALVYTTTDKYYTHNYMPDLMRKPLSLVVTRRLSWGSEVMRTL